MSKPLPQQTAVEYRACTNCGLTVAGSHGMVDCVAHLRTQITRLHRECIAANARAATAEEQLAEIRKVLADG